MEDVLKKILNMNLAEPYVWKLHLSSCEYGLLEQYILDHADELNGKLTPEMALVAIVYIAEWFRRNYNGHDQVNTCVVTCEAKELWKASRIDASKFLYKTETGQALYKYSIYVLGGLAIKHELKKNNSDKFLKALCRMYHGEEYTLENLDSENRAIAFRQSIKQKHSLYEFLREVLNDSNGIVDDQNDQLITRIKHANEDVLRSKFALEWLVNFNPSADTINRQLRVWLKPEEVGGGQHQYLRFDRIHIWGIPNPETKKEIFFGIRWWNGSQIVSDLDKSLPLITYSNNGNDGFVSWGVEKSVKCLDIPTTRLTHLEIIAFDKEGNEWLAQREEIKTWMQLWRVESSRDEWSSKQNRQHQTAVVYSDKWVANFAPDMQRCFKSRKYGVSDPWNWNYIYSDITLTDGHNDTFSLYNRSGYDQIYTKLYSETICYHEGGKVKYVIEDEEEGEIEKLYPIIFNLTDIRARHFETKDAIIDNNIASDDVCDIVQFKSSNGQYEDWTNEHAPKYGLLQLRVFYRGTSYQLCILYLKGPYHRDCQKSIVSYFNEYGVPCTYQDTISLNKHSLCPSIALKVGHAIIDVFRPTLIKEIYLDDKVITYVQPDKNFTLVEILKNRVKIADFSEQGYRCYYCKHIPSLFTLCEKGCKSQALTYFQDYTKWPASELDEFAPTWLCLAFTKEATCSKSKLALYKWNIYEEDGPEPFQYYEDFKVAKGDVVFQNMSKIDDDLSYMDPMLGRPNAFNKIHNLELRCFEIACRYNLYFSVLHPLRSMADRNTTRTLLVDRLLSERNGRLTESDLSTLQRFAEEFNLNINDMLEGIDNNQI